MMKFLAVLCLVAFAAAFSAVAAEHKAFTVDGVEIIALRDSGGDPSGKNRPELLVGLEEANAGKYLVDGAMKNSINCFVVKTGKETLLFDTGLGSDKAKGELPESLAAAGLKPEDIDAVIITHFHPDHIGGLVKGGEAVFPTARLMVPRREIETNPQAAMTFMTAYAGRLHTFEWDHPVADGVVALDASGHTPGHSAFLVDGKVLIAGDVIHFGGIQLPAPDVAVTYDTDPKAAIAARKRIFDMAVTGDYTVATMHLPFPGIGKVARDGDGYSFVETK